MKIAALAAVAIIAFAVTARADNDDGLLMRFLRLLLGLFTGPAPRQTQPCHSARRSSCVRRA
jgi:hypothetical protein